MAEKEKRRATTFRTSKGTIVNVAAPTVYVSPAFLSTEDVTNPTEMREVLRKELDDLYMRPVLKPTPGTAYALGVGTPYLVEVQEEGIGPYILFTGWNTLDGSKREVFIGDIDEDFKVSNVRKLIAVGDPSADFMSHDAVHALYNSYDGVWMVFTTSRYALEPAGVQGVACLFRYNRDFSARLSSHAPLLLIDGSLWRTTDSGVSPVRSIFNHANIAYVRRVGPAGSDLRGIYASATFTGIRPTPPLFTVPERVFPGWAEVVDQGYLVSQPCVLQLVLGKTGFIMLTEDLYNATTWNIYPFFVHPHRDYSRVVWGQPSFMGIAGRASEALIQPFGSQDVLNYGHPHLTWLPNRKLNLFFAMFPSTLPGYKHEIWVTRLPPERLDPRSYRAITYLPWYSDTILANAVTRAFPGYGRKTIYFTSTVSGNLDIQMDPFGDGSWETLDTLTGITSGRYQTLYSAHSIRLRFSVGATVTAKVVVEAGK